MTESDLIMGHPEKMALVQKGATRTRFHEETDVRNWIGVENDFVLSLDRWL